MKLHIPIVNVKQTFRILNKTERTSLPLLFLSAMLIVLLGACRDEDFVSQMSLDSNNETKGGILPVTSQGGLIQNNDGTWSTNNCRVPLVGPGRIVNQISTAFVSALNTEDNLGKIVNLDLTDEATLSKGVLGTDLPGSVISIKDLHHIYAPGQKVGIVYCESSGSVLGLDVLKGSILKLYKRGVEVQESKINTEASLLGLDLLSIKRGDKEEVVMACMAETSFDEVRLILTSVAVEALSSGNLSILYAFVGENPEIRATSEEDFKNEWESTPVINKDRTSTYSIAFVPTPIPNISDIDNIVDNDLNTFASFDVSAINSLLGGLKDHYTTVNFNKIIPANYEVGFKYSAGGLSDLGILHDNGPELRAYKGDGSDAVLQQSPGFSIIGGSVISGVQSVANMIIPEQVEIDQLQVRWKTGAISGLLGHLLTAQKVNIHYAYVRKPVTLDPSNYFSIPDDTTYISSYQLPALPEEGGNLVYNILSSPYGTIPSIDVSTHLLSGMTNEGVYRIQALYTEPQTGLQVSHVANIYRKVIPTEEGCNTFITADSHGAYATEAIGWKGCLLCLFNDTNNANAIVDKDPNNYATYNNILSLIEFEPVMAIQMNKPITPSKEIRTGFVIQPKTGLLDLTALKYYTIKLYRNGVPVELNTGDDNSTVNVGLLGNDKDKIRISVKTDNEFDRIELWAQGVAGLMEQIRIYNVFYEDVTCQEEVSADACMELITTSNADIDYSLTQLGGAISAGSSLDELGYVIDGNKESGAYFSSVADVLDIGGTSIGIRLKKPLAAKQTVGVILGGLPDVVSVSLLNAISLSVYDTQGNQIGSDFNLGTLGLDLISHDGVMTLEFMPETDFQAVKVTMSQGLADVAKTIKVNGFYYRRDTDGDGIPDCSETETETAVELYDGAHACEGDNLIVGAKTEATNGTLYMMECKNQTSGKTYEKEIELQQDNSGKFFSIPDLPKGEYLVSVYALGSGECLWNGAYATVHPLLTEWTGDVSTEWNEWDNWTEGAPWECTNVIIPSDVAQYPVIAAGDCCQNIHFEEGTAALNTHLLKYEKAFVDMRVKGGQYTYLSAPLQEMVTGDMYINPNVLWDKDDYFTVMNKNNYPENRVNPIVYQRIWRGTRDGAYELPAVGDGVPVEITQTGWSTDFNSVTMKYNAGEGFSLRAGKEGDYNSYRFRFPKAQSTEFATGTVSKETYSYYSEEGNFIREETFDRTPKFVGRFFNTNNGNVNVTLTAGPDGYLLVGNPYMAYISVTEFMTGNSITELKMYDGNTNRTVLMNGGDVLTSDSEQAGVIAPMQSVLVKTSATTINFTATMQVQPVQATPASRSMNNGLYISASKGGYTATCMLVKSEAADNAYRVSEDAEILMDGDSVPIVEVFTVVGSKALNIQQVRDAVRIPLGVCLRTPGDVRLMFSSDDVNWEDWKLEDTKTGQTYSMKELKQGITVAGMQSNSGRLVFVKD